MSRERIYILFCILVFVRDSSCMINSLYDTGEEIWKLYLMIDRIEFNTTKAFEDLFISKNGSNEEIKNQLTTIFKLLNKTEESMDFVAIRALFERFGTSAFIYHDLDMVNLFDEEIHQYYEKFQQYMIRNTPFSHEAFHNFAQEMSLNGKGSIILLRRTLSGNEKSIGNRKNLISLIGDYAISYQAEICNSPQLMSSILLQLFKKVMLFELKTNLMISFTNIYENIENTDIWKRMNSLMRSEFELKFGYYVSLFTTNLMKSDSSYLRACDPENGTWTQNDSFYELEGTIQATMMSYSKPFCNFPSCDMIHFGGSQRCSVTYHNTRSRCSTSIDNCASLGDVKACQLKTGTHKFEYVSSSVLGFLGRDSKCPIDNSRIIHDESLPLRRVCACSCYGNANKISLAVIESNVYANMVITGVRFLRKNQILYIQPREGKLSVHGRIIQNSERWVPIPHNEASEVHSVDRMNRVFFLDDLHLPYGFVLTGIQLSKITRSNVIGFAIGIFGSMFDYKTGVINSDDRFRIYEYQRDLYAGKSLIFDARSSIYTQSINIPSPINIKYVSLERSTLQSDFGQTTLPLFDAIPIVSKYSTPLAGIGIFHKGVRGYAGFIALRAFGIYHSDYFKQFEFDHLENGIIKFGYSHYH